MRKTRIVIQLVLVALLTLSVACAVNAEQIFTETDKASLVVDYVPGISDSDGELFAEPAVDLTHCLLEGVLECRESINVSTYGIPYSEEGKTILRTAFSQAVMLSPYTFNVEISYSYSYSSGYLVNVFPEYSITDKDEIAKIRAQIDEKINAIVACTDESMSDVEKLLVFYRELLPEVCYDDTREKYSVKDLLLDGTAVCQGYATTIYALAQKVGIPCGFVESQEMVHVWNCVYLDGKWYHLDATWDDTINAVGPFTYMFFLKSNEWFADVGNHSGFDFLENCGNKYDNYFWNNIQNVITTYCGHMFYVEDNHAYGSLCDFNCITGETKKIYDFTDVWFSNPQKTQGYNFTFSNVVFCKGRMYFNTPNKIMSCKIDGSDMKTELELSDSNVNSIYGCTVNESGIKYSVDLFSNAREEHEKRDFAVAFIPKDKAVVLSPFVIDGKIEFGFANESGKACNVVVMGDDENGKVFDVISVKAGFNSFLTSDLNTDSIVIFAFDENFSPLLDKVEADF